MKQLSLPRLWLSDGNSSSSCIGHDGVAHITGVAAGAATPWSNFFLLLTLSLIQNALRLLLELQICLAQVQLLVASTAWLAFCQQPSLGAKGSEFLFAFNVQGGLQWHGREFSNRKTIVA